MSIFNELDHFLGLNSSGIQEYVDGDALNNRIAEWLATPEGTVADNPAWGHNLRPFWHDPESPLLTIQLEMAVAKKLPIDVRDVTIRRIGVAFVDKDLCRVEIHHLLGMFQQSITLSGEVIRGLF
ncbi:hypothetical protein [Vreelandella alkaliphila]|uniref:Uncharacterized protein n=1 Tax=Vreelandella alkaliphila TaxID=272774 RepID=A0AAJ2S461_9GAMM|nr:hypothetical protein [Halomonas alkaliphila]MDX5979546.1 hypothetical protein [Halomonas alkaliphila]